MQATIFLDVRLDGDNDLPASITPAHRPVWPYHCCGRRSVNGAIAEMPQLVLIAHNVNGDDPAILDLQRGRL